MLPADMLASVVMLVSLVVTAVDSFLPHAASARPRLTAAMRLVERMEESLSCDPAPTRAKSGTFLAKTQSPPLLIRQA